MLMIEELGRDAIIDAVWAIERLNQVGYRAIELNEAIDKGLLSESKSSLLLEDLEKAKRELSASGQSSLDKVDKAVQYIDDLNTVVTAGESSTDDIFYLLSQVFDRAKEIVAEFSALKLDGKIANIKAFFQEGGKVAAIMDALAQEMNILSGFVKMISSAFAQVIRIMQKIPDGFKNSPTGKNKDIVVGSYIDNAAGKGTLSDFSEFEQYKIDRDELEKSCIVAMNDFKSKAGGSGLFSFKGVKNFFTNNAKTMGVGAFIGGLAALTIPVAGPLALAAVGAGIGAGIASKKRTPENPAKAYETDVEEMAEAIMNTKVNKLEGILPGFVKAIKGVNPGEFAKYAEEAAKAIQAVNDGFDVEKTITDFITKYDSSFPAFKELQLADSDLFQTIVRDIVATGDFEKNVKKLDGTTLQEPLKQFYKEFILGESTLSTGELILENKALAHDYTMTELLFEDSFDENTSRPRRKRSRSKSKTKQGASKRNTSRKSATPKSRSNQTSSKGQAKKVDKSQSNKTSSAANKNKYKAAKSDIKSFGAEQLSRAEKKPERKSGYEQSVDDRERSINKKPFMDTNRKKEITKIANAFEKKIKNLDTEDAKKPQPERKSDSQTEEPNRDEKNPTNQPQEQTPEKNRNDSGSDQQPEQPKKDTSDSQDQESSESVRLPDLAAFSKLQNVIANDDAPLTDSNKKFIAALYGDKISSALAKKIGAKNRKSSGGSDITNLLGINESYDRRLLRLSGIK